DALDKIRQAKPGVAASANGEKTRLRGAVEMWQAEMKLRVDATTLERYSYDLVDPLRLLGSVAVEDMTALTIADFQRKLVADGRGSQHIRRSLARLRQVLDRCLEMGLVATNAAKKVKLPRKTRKEMAPLTPTEVTALLGAAAGHRLEAL